MNYFLFFASISIIVTKFLDCYTTHIKINDVTQERNQFARNLMYRYGKTKIIWGIFLFTIVIVISSHWILIKYYFQTPWIWGYIILALIISVFQLAVAHTNYSRRCNIFTKWLLKIKPFK